MVLLKWSLLAATSGYFSPAMEAKFKPLPWLFLDQKLSLVSNDKYEHEVANIDMRLGAEIKSFEICLGHKSTLDSDLHYRPLEFVEISYKKEF